MEPGASKLGPALIAAVVIAAIWAAWRYDAQAALGEALLRIEALGARGALLFFALYVAACVLGLPGSVLTLGAGAVYGVARGAALVSLSSTAGAVAAFLVGRHLARDWVKRRLEAHPGFKAIDAAVAVEGWKIVGLTRLSPLFPFNLLNYGFGVSQVSLRDFALASWIGMMPGTVLYVYIGSLAGELGARGRERSPAEWALYGVGLAATAAVAALAAKIARAALAAKTHA